MGSKRHERTLARRSALQVLYQSEISGIEPDKVLDGGLVPEEAATGDYARALVLGVAAHKAEIDRLIGESSRNWAIDRMPVVDRSILRLAIFEMRYRDDVPQSVAINEAVELAKEFGGEDDSHRFINGVLGRLAREADAAAVDAIVAGSAQTGILADVAVPAAVGSAVADVAAPAAVASDDADVAAADAAAATSEGESAADAAVTQPAGEPDPAAPAAAGEPGSEPKADAAPAAASEE